MNTYLLIWNPTLSPFRDYSDLFEQVETGFPVEMMWSCGVRKTLPVGSRIFLMRLGHRQPIRGIFASGTSTSEPYADEHWDEADSSRLARYVDFRVDALLDPDVQQLLQPEQTVSSEFNWRPQSSGVEIPKSVAETLEREWLRHLHAQNVLLRASSSVESTARQFVEGNAVRVTVNRYERDPEARKACIARYGTECSVCRFDFGAIYGEIGQGFIHVHHLNPIAVQGGSHEVDPERDLRPVCPNCHAMIHRDTPPLSIEALKQILRDSGHKRVVVDA